MVAAGGRRASAGTVVRAITSRTMAPGNNVMDTKKPSRWITEEAGHGGRAVSRQQRKLGAVRLN